MKHRVAVIGSGSWGTALASLLGRKGMDVLMWAYEPEVARGIRENHSNPLYLPEAKLPENVSATNDIAEALAGRTLVVSAVPSRSLRSVWEGGAACIEANALLASCTKGIEAESLKLMSQVLDDCLPRHRQARRTVLSGPSFAKEVAAGLPTSVVIAGRDPAAVAEVQEQFRTPTFLTFTNDDVVGVEVGGAVKNVIAIAAGMSDGLGFGHNSRASIITRGLYEMIKIGRALGARPLTFAGLSGIGDLVLTCTAEISRNYTVGKGVGEGRSLAEVLAGMKMVAEGVPTAKAVHQLIERRGINAPICAAMYRILYEGLTPRLAVEQLCALPLKDELGALLK